MFSDRRPDADKSAEELRIELGQLREVWRLDRDELKKLHQASGTTKEEEDELGRRGRGRGRERETREVEVAGLKGQQFAAVAFVPG